MRKLIILIMLVTLFCLVYTAVAQSIAVIPAVIELNISNDIIAERNFEIINPSNKEMMFVIESPNKDIIELKPYVGKIAAGESKKIRLIFDSRKSLHKENEFEVYINVFSENRRDRGIPINTGVALKIKTYIRRNSASLDKKILDNTGDSPNEYDIIEETYSEREYPLKEGSYYSKNKNPKMIDPIGLMITLSIIIFGLRLYFSMNGLRSYT